MTEKKMMLPIELTKILYSNWDGTIDISSSDSQIYGKCLNGFCSVTFKNGNKYEGNFYNGLLHGTGKFTWQNGTVYEGQFTSNRITGKGIYVWVNGANYEGTVKNGLRHGNGIYKIDQSTYEGGWVEGKKEGKGKIIYKSGTIFQGNFKNGKKDGFGKMYYEPSGNYFQGQWSQDGKQGHGVMNWVELREKYFGQWHNNLQHGWGTHMWLDSKGQGRFVRNRYEGEWSKGMRQGYGVFHYANGSKYEGYWKNNMKQGLALYTDENGKMCLINFDKDKMMKKQNLKFDKTGVKKVANKRQLHPNAVSLCLRIDHIFYPFVPDLQQLFNLLLRNLTQLKYGYRGLANFYDQQSEFSFCLNFQGLWKMVRALKILGDLTLASLDRGFKDVNPEIKGLLSLVQQPIDAITYEDLYYEKQANNYEEINYQSPTLVSQNAIEFPFKEYKTHDRQKNIFMREFLYLLVWMAYRLNPNLQKPNKTVNDLIQRITPLLQTTAKSIVKGGAVDNKSQNLSSVSKGEKNISVHFRTVNLNLLEILKPKCQRFGRLKSDDLTITIRQLIGFGRKTQTIGDNQLALLQRILDKYMNPEITGRALPSWYRSELSPKILNIMNYELVEYEFIQIIYFLMIKKLPSHRETDETKKKYQEHIDKMATGAAWKDTKIQEQKKYKETRLLKSKKSEVKRVMESKRKQMERKKHERYLEKNRVQREQIERKLMEVEDIDILDEDEFEEEESQLSI